MQWLAEERLRESTERAFDGYGKTLENLTAFRYLGRVLMVGDDDFPAVVGTLCTVRKSWGQLSRILSREGADLKVSGHFLKR